MRKEKTAELVWGRVNVWWLGFAAITAFPTPQSLTPRFQGPFAISWYEIYCNFIVISSSLFLGLVKNDRKQ